VTNVGTGSGTAHQSRASDGLLANLLAILSDWLFMVRRLAATGSQLRMLSLLNSECCVVMRLFAPLTVPNAHAQAWSPQGVGRFVFSCLVNDTVLVIKSTSRAGNQRRTCRHSPANTTALHG
jgi:hypothetical protein